MTAQLIALIIIIAIFVIAETIILVLDIKDEKRHKKFMRTHTPSQR